jgi:hypothetical protein
LLQALIDQLQAQLAVSSDAADASEQALAKTKARGSSLAPVRGSFLKISNKLIPSTPELKSRAVFMRIRHRINFYAAPALL